MSEVGKLLSMSAVCVSAVCAMGAVHRVVPDEASKSVPGWESASTDLKAAIEGASSGDTVYVMNGHYDIAEEIVMTSESVTIRSVNPTTGETDFGGAIFDARKGDATRETRILKAKANLHVYGCQFVNAHLTAGNYDTDCGAALFLDGSYKSFYVNDCVFSNNYTKCYGAAVGGGWGAYPTFCASNTVFACNEATDVKEYSAGGAVGLFHGQSTKFRDCIFAGNVSTARPGAAAGCRQGAIKAYGCTFDANIGSSAFACQGGGWAVGCVFKNHSKTWVGVSRDCSLSNCVLTANSCTALIGADYASVDCWNSFVTNNTASYILVNNHAVRFHNSLIADNAFEQLFHTHPQWPSRIFLENCTLTRNTSAGAFWADMGNTSPDSGLAVTNCVIWGNSFGATSVAATVPQFGGYNCSDYAYIQNITDPKTLWTDSPELSTAPGCTGRLKDSSPYLDCGARLDWMTDGVVDLAGDPRVIGENPALGCYERPVSWIVEAKLVVPDEASKSVPGWENASTDLKGTIEGAKEGESVYLMNGHYDVAETIAVAAKNVTIRSLDATTLETGFGGAILDARKGDATREIRILKARGGLRIHGCQFVNGRLTLDKYDSADAVGAGILLDGTVYLNDCVFSNNYVKCYGAAIAGAWATYPSVIAKNCLFAGNEAEQSANSDLCFGGAYGAFNAMSSSFADCVFTNNVSTGKRGTALGTPYGSIAISRCTFVANAGGSIVYEAEGGTLVDCLFVSNQATTVVYEGAATLSNCVFTANDSYSLVAGSAARPLCWNTAFTNNAVSFFTLHAHALRYRNCLIADNVIADAMLRTHFLWSTVNSFENCTIANNRAKDLWTDYQSSSPSSGLALTNTVFWGNVITYEPSGIAETVTRSAAYVCTDYPFIQGLADAGTLLTTAPGFRAAAKGDYRIRPGSKCREYGVRPDWMTASSVDLDGNPRLVNRDGVANAPDALPDLGCYEAQVPAPGFLLFMR